jgi:DNA-binding transcriptional LysR family regulator
VRAGELLDLHDQTLRELHGPGDGRPLLVDLLAGRLDVPFGRSEGLGQPFPTQLVRHLIRLEPLAPLLPAEHPLAALDPVPLAALAGTQVDSSAGNDQAPEWADLGARLPAAFGARSTPSEGASVGA